MNRGMIFCFYKETVEDFRREGINTIYYLTLAANSDRLFYVYYERVEDLLDKSHYYLDHVDERKQLLRMESIELYNIHRVQQILEQVKI